MTPTEQIEDRLRAALEAQSHDVQVSPDAWQQNQRLLAADRSHRSRKLLGAAAAVVAVAAVLGAGALLGGDGSGGSSAGGSDDPFTTEYLLGAPVEAETLTIDGEATVHEIALSDMTGKGPSLCDRYVAASSGSGSCSSREPSADKPGVAFDWLSGTEGGGDLRGVLAGVDGRVTKVRIWMDNGDMVLAALHPTGWEDTKMFALTLTGDAPTPQRLVAYGRDGNVLEAADLTARFGDGWLPVGQSCQAKVRGTWPDPAEGGPDDLAITFGANDALIEGGSETPLCIDPLLSRPIAGMTQFGDRDVAVLAPEVDLVRVQDGSSVVEELMPYTANGSPWRLVVLRAMSAQLTQRVEVVAFDIGGNELDREYLSRPASP